MMGLPPSDKEFTVQEILIAQFRDGKIAKVWRLLDTAALETQLQSQ